MKILMFFLLGVISSAQAMEKESVLSSFSAHADSYEPRFCLTDFSDEIKIKFYDYVAQISSLEIGIKSIYSLASSCRDFRRLFNDEALIKSLVLHLEKRIEDPVVQSMDKKKTIHYWRLLAVVTKLKNKIALRWFFSSVDPNSSPIKNIKRVSSKECMDLTNVLNQYYGGLSVAEYRFLNKRPVKILESIETNRLENKKTRLIKSLSLKACGLVNLDGLLSLYDLKTVHIFDVSANKISEINAEYLAPFENLITLDFANNDLQSIDLGIFATLKHLKIVDLSINKISTVLCTSYVLGNILERLDLSRNALTYVNPGVIEKVRAGTIDLTSNKIRNAESLKALAHVISKRILVDE